MNADGTGATNLTNGGAQYFQPSSSPDGGRIIFVAKKYYSHDDNKDTYVTNAGGSGLTRLTNQPGPNSGPSWSPDGKYIVFWSERDGDRKVYGMSADGSAQMDQARGPGKDWGARWRP